MQICKINKFLFPFPPKFLTIYNIISRETISLQCKIRKGKIKENDNQFYVHIYNHFHSTAYTVATVNSQA
jgi:hypothetical protein